MRDFRDAKAMAQTLRGALNAKSVILTHSESLELVAQVLGFRDWNVLSARIQSDQQATAAALGSTGSCLPVVPLRPDRHLTRMPSQSLHRAEALAPSHAGR